jgi:uncharacterized protein
MIVVSDTSPLTALLTVGEEHLLPRLFTEVVIPEAVQVELLRNHARLPDWLRVAHVQNPAQVGEYSKIVDAGEAEAIELARELHADRLLIDERKGRKLVVQEGVAVMVCWASCCWPNARRSFLPRGICSNAWMRKPGCIFRRTFVIRRSRLWVNRRQELPATGLKRERTAEHGSTREVLKMAPAAGSTCRT